MSLGQAPIGSSAPGDQGGLKLVGFLIEDWRFAVRLEQVQTSIMPCAITRVFQLPDYVRGIINLRGTIVGVLDLGRLLGVGHDGRGVRRLLVVTGQGVQAAIPVQEVFRLPEVSPAQVGPLPPSITTAQRQYLEGVINTSSFESWGSDERAGTITLVDTRTLFEAPAIRALRGRP